MCAVIGRILFQEMMSFKTIRKFRCLLAIGVTLSISLIFGCGLLCDLGIISFPAPQPSVISESSEHSHQRGDEHHSSGHQDDGKDEPHKHGSTEYHHDSPKEEGCCSDLTQQFYSTLVSSASAPIKVIHAEVYKLVSILTFGNLIEIKPKRDLSFRSKCEYRPHGPPGYTRNSTRVLFCSLLI